MTKNFFRNSKILYFLELSLKSLLFYRRLNFQIAEYNWIWLTANNWCLIPYNAIIELQSQRVTLKLVNLKLKTRCGSSHYITVKSAFQLIDKTANLILSKFTILILSQFLSFSDVGIEFLLRVLSGGFAKTDT